MYRLSALYDAMSILRKEGLPINEELKKEISELEEEIIQKEILPELRKTMETTLQPIKRELSLVVDYKPGKPLNVHLCRKQDFAVEEADAGRERKQLPRWYAKVVAIVRDAACERDLKKGCL